jgi:putative transposase
MADGNLGEGTRQAALAGAWACFEDEAGQSLRPGRARTWAARGHTPVVRVSGNAGRLSVAGMACLKPGRPGRFFYRLRVHRRRKGDRPSMSEADYAHLITAAHHALGAPVIVIWDNLNTHRSRKMPGQGTSRSAHCGTRRGDAHGALVPSFPSIRAASVACPWAVGWKLVIGGTLTWKR